MTTSATARLCDIIYRQLADTGDKNNIALEPHDVRLLTKGGKRLRAEMEMAITVTPDHSIETMVGVVKNISSWKKR